MRAILPSRPSKTTAKPIAMAARLNSPLRALVTAKNPQKMVPMVNKVGRT